MPINGTKIIDLDSHLVGDVENWEHWIEEEWRSQLPRRLPRGPEERGRTVAGDRVLIESDLGRQAGERHPWARPEDYTAEGRVGLLDQAGIDIAVLSPNSTALNLLRFAEDPGLAAAYCRAQNNYMAHYCSEHPDRLTWAGAIPMQDVDEAIKELHRAVDMGMKGINQKATPIQGREWWDRYYDPIFSELQSLHVPIIFHETRNGSIGQDRFHENYFFAHMVGRVFESMVCCLTMICGGVLERFPELKVVLLETGASQMPWWIGRMDEHFEKLPHLVPWLEMKPSDYFRRQVYVGCEPFEDPWFDWAVEALGDDLLVLATDMPHWDSALPAETLKPVLETTRISEQSKEKILGRNAAALLGL